MCRLCILDVVGDEGVLHDFFGKASVTHHVGGDADELVEAVCVEFDEVR